ncbi:MAG TPA: OmpA family protein [Burkholderiales bacterium]
MNDWHFVTRCFSVAAHCADHLLRRGVTVSLMASLAGCAWLWPARQPEPEPEREAVQYDYAPLPVVEPPPVQVAVPQPPPPLPRPPAPKKTTYDQITILPREDGPIGGVVVHQDSIAILLDKPYATAVVEGPGMVTESIYDAQLVKQEFAPALSALPGKPTQFLVYFLEGTDELTPESNAEVEKIFAELATRPAPEILVIGHTDAVGSIQYNDKLSLQRAEHVRAELIQRGIAEDRISVEGRGKREPLVETADGVAEPKNRRVEISVR